MARIEDIERRLLNWARWRHGGRSGGLGYAAVSWNATPSRAAYRESVIPTSDAEAADTDTGVALLPADLRRAVERIYLDGMSVRRAAARLSCAPATVQIRVDQAHKQLQDWITERQRQRADERARVEALQVGRAR